MPKRGQKLGWTILPLALTELFNEVSDQVPLSKQNSNFEDENLTYESIGPTFKEIQKRQGPKLEFTQIPIR